MRVLGIESSCDETAAALVNERGEVLVDVIASQIKTHGPYGGIVPELASRAHMRAVVPVIQEALQKVPGGLQGVDAIAVTRGPGLVGSLLVGVQAAKALAWSADKPIVGVNHLDGHLFAVYLRRPDREDNPEPPQMPYVALLVSGGHTALYRVEGFEQVELIGQTRDDAAGEAYDKAAKLLGLGYPGGPVIDRLAAQGNPKAVPLPMPMASRQTTDFSFSGLKTALARHVQTHGIPKDDALADLCASFQHVVIESLVRKSLRACQEQAVPRLVITGGVAANRGLRARAKEVCEQNDISLHVPPPISCTDNAAMIAMAAVHRLQSGERDPLSFEVYSRDPERRRGKFRRDGTLVPRQDK